MTRLTIDDVHAYIDGVCFKTGPPGTVGAETEWLVVDRLRPAEHVSLEWLRKVMDAAGPLPAGSNVTYEPGGQLELSSVPCAGLSAVHAALAEDVEYVKRHLAYSGLALSGYGVDPLRPPLFQLRTDRYDCMSTYLGTPGLDMMCSTASLQVCVDIGVDRADAARRWRLTHALGPVLTAIFANSPLQAGRRTGLRSTRQVIWDRLDPGRTLPVLSDPGEDPATAWARYALDARVMLIRDEDGGCVADPGITFDEWVSGKGSWGYPTEDDLVFHLSTLFPPVRPRGWYELRMIDALPEPYWPVPIALAVALLDDPVAADLAAEAAEPAAGRWHQAARDALTDPVLGRAAQRCFDAALPALHRLGAGSGLVAVVEEYADRYVARGRCPADDMVAPEVRWASSADERPSTRTKTHSSLKEELS